jgi:hypothetical protein
MKTLSLAVAALVAVAYATDSWTSAPITNVNAKKTNYLLGLISPATNTDPVSATPANLQKPIWKIETQTFLDRDTGI